jgi:hypothetical protein
MYGGWRYGQEVRMVEARWSLAAEVEVKAMSLEEAVKQVQAAIKVKAEQPTHFKVKACYYEEE